MTGRRDVKSDEGSVAQLVLDSHDSLGEGPAWLPDTGELLRVDIDAGVVHRWAPATGRTSALVLGDCVSAAIPADGGGLVLTRRHRVELWRDGVRRLLGELDADRPGNRCNDAKCDPAGRLWAGTLSTTRERGAAALYRLDPGAPPTRVLAATVANGLGWSPAGERMYFIDTAEQRVDVLDYDAATGAASDRRPLVHVDPAAGMPDGLAVDVEGGIWVALFGGGAIHRYAPDGERLAAIALPASHPTSLAFGGEDLRTLYVTSARGGGVLALDPGVRGLPVARYAGT
jgi:sugar lactone lactonase YvrE